MAQRQTAPPRINYSADSRDQSMQVLLNIVLPAADNLPARFFQFQIRSFISSEVLFKLLSPKCAVRLGAHAMNYQVCNN